MANDEELTISGIELIMAEPGTDEYRKYVKGMLHKLQELVPGQLFRDVGAFHQKFGLEPTKDPGHRLPDAVLKFRVKFMLEELQEYATALGGEVTTSLFPSEKYEDVLELNIHAPEKFDPELALDALADLIYVALGTAYLHRFDLNEAFRRIQEKNMQKVRAASADDSKRGSTFDVVKPPGWTPPDHSDLIGYRCNKCGRSSRILPKGSRCAFPNGNGQLCDGTMVDQ